MTRSQASDFPRWWRLLDAVVDESATAQDWREVDELLQTSGEFRRLYVAHMQTVGELRWIGRNLAERAVSNALPAGRRGVWLGSAVRFFSRPTPASLSVAAVFIGLLITTMGFVTPPFYRAIMRESSQEVQDAPTLAAHVTNSRGAVWPAGERASRRGDRLLTGDRLHLLEGVVELTYVNGVEVRLQGPVVFHVRSLEAGELESGKMAAHVPSEAGGFVVQTEIVDVRDLGTQFGVEYDPEGVLDVQVSEGSVALEPGKELSERHVVVAGEAWRFDASTGSLAETPYEKEKIVQRLPPSDHPRSYEQWREFSTVVRQDPGLIAYYTFEPDAASPGKLPNRAANGVAEDGSIAAAEWTTGRWPDKGALQFGRSEQYVRMNVPGEFSQLTFAAWVKFDKPTHDNCALIMSKGQAGEGQVHWLTDHTGEGLQFTIIGMGGATPKLEGLREGGWNFLAATCDGATGTVCQFVNGRELPSTRLEPGKLVMYEASIANWLPSKARPLQGAIDEFYVFDRVLSSGELRGMYLLDSRPFD